MAETRPTYEELAARVAELEAEAGRAKEREAALAAISQRINEHPLDVEGTLLAVAEAAWSLTASDGARVWLVEGDEVVPGPVSARDPEYPDEGRRVRSAGPGPVSRAVRERQTIAFADILEGLPEGPYRENAIQSGQRSAMVVPLRREDEISGALWAWRAEIRPYGPAEIAILEAFAAQAAIAIETARSQRELAESNRELTESLDQQTAIADVLGIISRSPNDPGDVLSAVMRAATSLCEADDGFATLFEAGVVTKRLAVVDGAVSWFEDSDRALSDRRPADRSIIDGKTVQFHGPVADMLERFPDVLNPPGEHLTVLASPLKAPAGFLGHLCVRRYSDKPFDAREITLLETFADQAVIAIENARLFNELQERNGAMADALERQVATSEVLEAIGRSPVEVQPVLDTIASEAKRLTQSRDGFVVLHEGDSLHTVAHTEGTVFVDHGDPATFRADQPVNAAFLSKKTVHHWGGLAGMLKLFPTSSKRMRKATEHTQSSLAVPLVRQGTSIGALVVLRASPQPYPDEHVALLETFADQAVIAIENARLFNELQESNREVTEALDQQTAMAEVLSIISTSATDAQPVMDAIVAAAVRVFSAHDSAIHLLDEGSLRCESSAFAESTSHEARQVAFAARTELNGTAIGEAVLANTTVHAFGGTEAFDARYPVAAGRRSQFGIGSALATPLRREGNPVGTLLVRRQTGEPFGLPQIALFEAFADQAVIAIENARLFNELQERNREVGRALEQQTATAEVMAVVGSSVANSQPVFDAIVARVGELFDADSAQVTLRDGDEVVAAAAYSNSDSTVGGWIGARRPLSRDHVYGPAMLDGTIARFTGTRSEYEARFPRSEFGSEQWDRRKNAELVDIVHVPLRAGAESLGTLGVVRIGGSGEVARFDSKAISLMETFAQQAAIAIENARLFNELQERNREVTEALDQQTAVAEVLALISRAPTDLTSVLTGVAERATVLTGSENGFINWLENGETQHSYQFNLPPDFPVVPLGRFSVTERFTGSRTPADAALAERVPKQVWGTPEELLASYPDILIAPSQRRPQSRLAVPLLHAEEAIGTLIVVRMVPEPFTGRQVEALQTFADQAVIAIENARLFNELQESNREVTEALEQQTAMANILEVISQSPTDGQPVLDAITETAMRLLAADGALISQHRDGELVYSSTRGAPGFVPGNKLPLDDRTAMGRAFLGSETIQIEVDQMPAEYLDMLAAVGVKVTPGTLPYSISVATPLFREQQPVGVLSVIRTRHERFSPKQLALLETFADQAVIAIENARLFNELQERNREVTEALDQQTAMAEVLSIIASSPTDVGPVLDAVIRSAVRLCEAEDGVLYRPEGDLLRPVAVSGDRAVRGLPVPNNDSTVSGRALRERRVVSVDDVEATPFAGGEQVRSVVPYRTVVAAPLLQGEQALGTISLIRREVRPFSQKQVDLLKAFADQAVIAIENARLFNELQERNREVTEALDQQTAMADVLQIISRSATDPQPVLDEIVRRAVELVGANRAALELSVSDAETKLASFAYADAELQALETFNGRRVGDVISLEGRAAAEALRQGAPVAFDGSMEELAEKFPTSAALGRADRYERVAFTSVPLLRGEDAIGFLMVVHRDPDRASSAGADGDFGERQVAVLQAFADQAVIAIENARLFNELQERNREVTEALDQQTALAEVLNIISSSPTDAQPVLEKIVSVGGQLCRADGGVLFLPDGDILRQAAGYGHFQPLEVVMANDQSTLSGRVMTERSTIHVTDLLADIDLYPGLTAIREAVGSRTVLVVPLLRGNVAMGTLSMARNEVQPFSAQEITLLETFADQAVIAIENARLFNELQERTQELEIASRHKSEFLANMSHELRTPLNAIIGYAELLQEESADLGNEEMLPDLGKIHSAGRHLLTLISGILDIAKVEAGRMTMYLEDFDIATLVRETEEIVRPLVEKNGNTFTVDCPADIGRMHADLVKSRQVLFNLLSNAAKFTEGGAVELKVRRESDPERITFAVRDTGIGITGEQLDRLFEAFSQAEDSTQRKYGGTGLGLALSRSFCLMMGGDIAVETSHGEGSTFTVTIPATVVEPQLELATAGRD